MKILITGGLGYIGSHLSYFIFNFYKNNEIFIIDDKSSSRIENEEFLKNNTNIKIINDSFENFDFLNNKIDIVIHLAANANVRESIDNPKKYYDNNVIKTIKLLNLMVKYNIRNIIFASSCSVYGDQLDKVNENTEKNPKSSYGFSKYIIEEILKDYKLNFNINYLIFRFFNVVGNFYNLYESSEIRLIPLCMKSLNDDTVIKIFGNDFNTHDGTMVRDYIHIFDIVNAIMYGIKYLNLCNKCNDFNLGTGIGTSVFDIIKNIEIIFNKKIKHEIINKNSGDAEKIICNPCKICNELNFDIKYKNIKEILSNYTYKF